MKQIKSQREIDKGLARLAKNDPRLVDVIAKSGPLPLRLQAPGFEGLAGIIISQQVSRASAQAIHARFLDAINPVTPAAYLDAGEKVWIEIGLSRAKQKALTALSEAILSGDLDLVAITDLDAETAIAKLTAIKGIGPWTAEVYLLFCAGHPDIFPAGDVALQESVRAAFSMSERPSIKELQEIAEHWSPWRGVASRLFWAYYRVLKGGKDALPV